MRRVARQTDLSHGTPASRVPRLTLVPLTQPEGLDGRLVELFSSDDDALLGAAPARVRDLDGGKYGDTVASELPGRSISLRVRAASAADIPAVKSLRDAFYAEFPPPRWRDESWETYADDIVQIVRDGGALLAEHASETVAFALAWSEGLSAVKLGDLYVLPRFRGEGTGRALVYAVAELARSRGAAHVHLTANLEALAFYDQLAFREESRNLAVRVDELLSRSARA